MADLIGSCIENRYEIHSRIGTGSFSTVYKGLDRQYNRLVALKALDPQVQKRDRESAARFRREASTLCRLRHENVVRLLDVKEESGRWLLVLEYLEGGCLSGWTEGRNPLRTDVRAALGIVRQIAEGLDYTHRRGVLHRDIKPSNIMVLNGRPQGEAGAGPCPRSVKILDFGLARLIDYCRPREAPDVAGSFFYMSPEQAGLLKRPIDQRADLYSLGILCYELLAGRLPYTGRDAGAILRQHVAKVPMPLQDVNPAVPEALCRIVARLMAKSPEDRYPSAGALLAHLNALEESFERGEQRFVLPVQEPEARDTLKARVRLVERCRELEVFRQCVEEAMATPGRLLLVTGEAGAGKTRLMEELRDQVSAEGGTFLYGGCEEYSSRIPYHPFGEVLAEAARQHRRRSRQNRDRLRKDLESWTGDHVGPLLGLAPELEELIGPAPVLQEPERIPEAVACFLCSLATRESPLVLALDDLHWGQEESFQVLMRILERLGRVPALVILLYRGEEVEGNPHLQKCLKQIRRNHHGTRTVQLRPLSPEGVRAMVRESASMSGNGYRALYEDTYRITRGNPFFVLETLRTMLGRKVLRWSPEEGRWSYDPGLDPGAAVSANVVDIILRRLERLGAETRQVLSVASAMGRQFTFERLLAVSSLEEDDLLDHLDRLVHHRFVEETGSAENAGYRFFHDKIRNAVYEQTPAEEKRALHERIGREFEKEAGADPGKAEPFQLAHHFCRGVDASRALRYAVQAGDKASSQGANREALYYYEEAARRLDGEDGDTFRFLHERIGDLSASLGEYDRALEAYQGLAGRHPVAVDRARLERKIGTAYFKKAEPVKAFLHLDNALVLLGKKPHGSKLRIYASIALQALLRVFPAGPRSLLRRKGGRSPQRDRELCEIHRVFACLNLFMSNPRTLLSHFLFIRYAERIRDPSLQADAYCRHAIFLAHLRMFRRARACLRKGLGLCREQGDDWGLANTKCYMGSLDHIEGRLEDGIRNLEESLPELERTESYWELSGAYLHLASLQWTVGNHTEAFRCLEKMKHLHEDWSGGLGGLTAYVCMSITFFLMGDARSCSRELEKSRAIAERSPMPWILACHHASEGLCRLMERKWEDACQELERSMRMVAESSNFSFYTTAPFLWLVRAYLARAEQALDRSERNACLAKVGRLLRKSRFLMGGFPVHAGQWWILRGVHLGQRGSLRRAERAFAKGLTGLGRIRARYSLVQAHREIADFWQARGQPDKAADSSRRAQAMLEEMGLAGNEEPLPRLPEQEAVPGAECAPEPAHTEEESAWPAAHRGLSSFLEASQLVTSSLDLKGVLERIVDLCLLSLGAERGFLMLYGEEDGACVGDPGCTGAVRPLAVLVARNMDRETLEEEGFSFSRSTIREVERTGRGVLATDAKRDARFAGSESVQMQGLRSILCVPLRDQDRRIGLLYLDNHLVSHLFTQKELDFMQSLASFAVLAIRDARAYAKIGKQRDEIGKQRDEIQVLKERLHEEVAYLKEEIRTEHNFEEMVGSGRAMREVFRFIETAAPLGQPVLILGETGTGKELVARAIHRRSPRAERPFIKVNCAAIPEGLLESELFGHERGAFTGAVQRKVGRFELAHQGTLFLDEIGEMSPALQAKLLRVLEDKEFERVGGTRTLKVQLSVISATHRDLEREIEKGSFREDLYYRLNVLPVRLPPLRERREDIPLLLAHFVAKFNKKFSKQVGEPDRATLDRLCRYPWPGNVRELEHLVERSMALSRSHVLEVPPLSFPGKGEQAAFLDVEPPETLPADYPQAVEAYKRTLVKRALDLAGGSNKEAASLMGISPGYLSKLTRRLRIRA